MGLPQDVAVDAHDSEVCVGVVLVDPGAEDAPLLFNLVNRAVCPFDFEAHALDLLRRVHSIVRLVELQADREESILGCELNKRPPAYLFNHAFQG